MVDAGWLMLDACGSEAEMPTLTGMLIKKPRFLVNIQNPETSIQKELHYILRTLLKF